MILNLPPKISSKFLNEFDLGNHEAIKDDLLDKCFCNIAPVQAFLKGDKDYLLGVKGTGKSAIFRQLMERHICFRNTKKLNQILVPIDQEIDYLSVKNHLHSSLQSSITDEDVRARFVWEIYIVYRIINQIKESNLKIDEETKGFMELVLTQFSFTSKRPTLLEFISSAKRTIGVKMDMAQTGMLLPDVYISAEPGSGSESERTAIGSVTLNLAEIQNRINRFLKDNKAIVYVLIDNLDDFLVREEYDAQKMVLQGLLATSKDYSRHRNIKIKAFLRTEVFHRVDMEKIGGLEKIKPNAVDLEWSSSDIRRFVSERFIYNIQTILNVEKLEVVVGEDNRVYRRNAEARPFYMKWWRKFFGLPPLETTQETTAMDRVWRTVITCFLPRTVNHYTSRGVVAECCDVFEYIDTHFCLANSRVTPRAILIYLEKLLAISASYYSEQLYPEIVKDENNEYPVFQRIHMMEAYGKMQEDVVGFISSAITHPEWKDRIASLLTNIGSNRALKFREIRKHIKYNVNEDARELLAFLEHLGVLKCENKSVHLPDRIYKIPIILQKNWAREYRNRATIEHVVTET